MPLSEAGNRRAVTVSRKSEGTEELWTISGFEKTDSTKRECIEGILCIVAGLRELESPRFQLSY